MSYEKEKLPRKYRGPVRDAKMGENLRLSLGLEESGRREAEKFLPDVIPGETT